jgi:hypothetical protein
VVPLADYVPYQVVERALALMYGADDSAQRGALRARLDGLKRAKAVGINPGRGQRIVYDAEARVWLLLALELEEFGIEPAAIGALFERDRETLRKLAAKAANTGSKDEDILLTVQPAFVSAGWRGKSDLPTIGKIGGRKAMDGFYEWLRSTKPGGVTGSSPRACVFNLSARLRALDAALVEAAKPQPPAPTGMAKQILDAGKAARGEMTLKEFRAKHRGKRSK